MSTAAAKTVVTRINIYTVEGAWYYAAWCGTEHDHNDSLDAESEDEARAEVSAMFPAATIKRVDAR